MRTWYDEYGMVSGVVLLRPGGAATVTPGADPSESLARPYAEISPDGPDHYLYRGLLGGELAVIPATSHWLLVEKAQHSGAWWRR